MSFSFAVSGNPRGSEVLNQFDAAVSNHYANGGTISAEVFARLRGELAGKISATDSRTTGGNSGLPDSHEFAQAEVVHCDDAGTYIDAVKVSGFPVPSPIQPENTDDNAN